MNGELERSSPLLVNIPIYGDDRFDYEACHSTNLTTNDVRAMITNEWYEFRQDFAPSVAHAEFRPKEEVRGASQSVMTMKEKQNRVTSRNKNKLDPIMSNRVASKN